jgi:glyoxylase-like metal-dependent hydrolase (beta-lactamase superfamily II)/rhodanese-related sulfurtransferase
MKRTKGLYNLVQVMIISQDTQDSGGRMYFEQFYLGCLAHASYLLGSEGEAIVVDPQRDVDNYLQAAEKQGLKIRHIFETHLHADFVSGHKELAARTGAKIYIGAKADAKFPHVAVADGFELHAGKVRVSVLETPGHTLEGVCLVITDESKSAKPWAVLTGDTLFLGDVGRPDLSKTHSPQELAGLLYDSLHKKLMTLADDVLVYPAHGAGSLCGRNMRADRSSTIGTERLTNYALQIPTRDAFVKELTANLPTRPEYFLQDAEINREGAGTLSDLKPLQAIPPSELKDLMAQGVVALDIRPGDVFAAGHVPGSVNIPLSGQFASWAGTLLGLACCPVLIAETLEQLEEGRMRLARVGIEDARGFLQNGMDGWCEAGLEISSIPQVTVQSLADFRQTRELTVLDVRRQPEWEAGHIHGAEWWALDQFKTELPKIDPRTPLAVHCKSGYRSMIACSMLQRAGFENVTNVIGGFDAWQQAKLPVEAPEPVTKD